MSDIGKAMRHGAVFNDHFLTYLLLGGQ